MTGRQRRRLVMLGLNTLTVAMACGLMLQSGGTPAALGRPHDVADMLGYALAAAAVCQVEWLVFDAGERLSAGARWVVTRAAALGIGLPGLLATLLVVAACVALGSMSTGALAFAILLGTTVTRTRVHCWAPDFRLDRRGAPEIGPRRSGRHPTR
jgi:hypothetical protein